MSDDGFYEDDESVDDVRVAWNAGEKGTTSGRRDLNQRSKFIVDEAVSRLESRQAPLQVVESGTNATTGVSGDQPEPVDERAVEES